MSSIITFTYCSKWNHLIYKALQKVPGGHAGGRGGTCARRWRRRTRRRRDTSARTPCSSQTRRVGDTSRSRTRDSCCRGTSESFCRCSSGCGRPGGTRAPRTRARVKVRYYSRLRLYVFTRFNATLLLSLHVSCCAVCRGF